MKTIWPNAPGADNVSTMRAPANQNTATMGRDDFRAWLGRHGLTWEQAGVMLASPRAAKDWFYGECEVNALATVVMRLVDEKPRTLAYLRRAAKESTRVTTLG